MGKSNADISSTFFFQKTQHPIFCLITSLSLILFTKYNTGTHQCSYFKLLFLFQLIMQKRDVILTAVFSSLAALILIAGIGAACYFFHKRRRKREQDEEDSQQGTCSRFEPSQEKKSKLNGFLSLKTPLISTKTLG